MGPSDPTWDQRSKLEFTKEQNGIYYVTLKVQLGASARVSLHGGQVVSWKNERGEELLFTSSKVWISDWAFNKHENLPVTQKKFPVG